MPKHFSEPDSPAPRRRRRATGEDRVFDNGYDPRQDFADSEYGQGTYGQDAYGQDQYRDQAATRGQGAGYGQGNGARRGSYTQTPYVQPPYAQDPYAKGGNGQQQDPYTQGAYGRQQDPYAESNYVEQEAPEAPGGLPRVTRLKPNLPDNHLQYALTWFSLAAALAVIFLLWAFGPRRRRSGVTG